MKSKTVRRYARLLLAIAVLCLAAIPAAASERWIDFADTDWYTENTSAKEFTITTAEELAGFAELVNGGTQTFKDKTVKLGADIDLAGKAWTSIGGYDQINNYSKTFQGTFDGCGFTIANLGEILRPDIKYGGMGLFGYIYTAETQIRNLAVTGNVVFPDDGGHMSNGVIVGMTDSTNWGSNNMTIESCMFKGTIKARRGMLGGIAGSTYCGLKNCHVYADIEIGTGEDQGCYVGGVCGVAARPVENCFFEGSIKVDTFGRVNAGGLLGKSETKTEIINCIAKGKIDVLKSQNAVTGGLIGVMANRMYDIMTGSTAECEINSAGTVGGIAGSCYMIYMEHCSSACTITTDSENVGGIFGFATKDRSGYFMINGLDDVEWLGEGGPENCTADMEVLEKTIADKGLSDVYSVKKNASMSDMKATSAAFVPIVRLSESRPYQAVARAFPEESGNIAEGVSCLWGVSDRHLLRATPQGSMAAKIVGLEEGTGEINVGASGFQGDNSWNLKAVTKVECHRLESMELSESEIILNAPNESKTVTATLTPSEGISYPVLNWTYAVVSGDEASVDDLEIGYVDSSLTAKITLRKQNPGAEYLLTAHTVDGTDISKDVAIKVGEKSEGTAQPRASGGGGGGCNGGAGMFSLLALIPLFAVFGSRKER
jgi:hypothetical protein